MSVAFVREESAEAAQEITLPERPISAHPNLVTQSGHKALQRAAAESGEALKAAQGIEDPNERRRAVELAARDAGGADAGEDASHRHEREGDRRRYGVGANPSFSHDNRDAVLRKGGSREAAAGSIALSRLATCA